MIPSVFVVTPAHRCDARPAVAAARAGACGILDLGLKADDEARRSSLRELVTYAGRGKSWGVRWDILASPARMPERLRSLCQEPWPLLVIGGIDFQRQKGEEVLSAVRPLARCVLAEAYSIDDAAVAEEAGFEGTVLVGCEAGGRTGVQSAYILLQQARGRLRKPYWIRGAMGPQTAAAALLAGAAGVVLAPRRGTVSRLLADFRRAVQQALRLAKTQAVLAPESEFAQRLGVKFPVLQGPMAWVSDTADFCRQVAENGALPLLALGSLGQPAVDRLLADAAAKLGNRPWGVGLYGYLPEGIRREQTLALQRTRPDCALLSGGNADQVNALKELGISAFACIPSVAQLRQMLGQGVRKHVLQGCEGGGRVGTATSFTLWQAAIHELLSQPAKVIHDLQVVFAGGIHDAMSAAMVAVIAAPLAARGVKIGLMMGTAYLLTPEAVSSGAITAEFQRQAIACRQTRLLGDGPAGALRCAATAAVEDFFTRQRQLTAAGRTAEEIRYALEMFQVGRQQLAAKGVVPAAALSWSQAGSSGTSPTESAAGDGLLMLEEERQRRLGLFVLGEAAILRGAVQPMAELHEAVCRGIRPLLDRAAEALPVWSHTRPRKRSKEALAVVGLGCIFPQSPNVQQYWQNIIRRFDAVREAPADRWRVEDFFDPDRLKPDRVYSKWGTFLDPVVFDPFRYRIPPVSLPSIEPVQLLALEVARQALEDAGYQRPEFPRERTAVIFAAAGTHDNGLAYSFRTALRHWLPQVEPLDEATRQQILADLENKLPKWTEDSFPGFLPNVVSGRISNRFDLTGANFTVDAACASSFAALQVAAEQLRSGTCDAALVGSVDGSNNAFCFMSFAKTQALSPRGRSRPFDESADGISLGEGVAAVVLKRLSDAQRDGDKIYAVIRGLGSSSDGSARSLTAPFPEGQILAIRRAYEDAGISPATVTLVESHGTGTTVGDRVEVQALTQLFAAEGAAARSCAIGSIKSMIGHTKTTAGLASLLKAILALEHRVLPPTIGVERPNAALRQEDCPFYICSESRPWLSGNGVPRRAGVSAFGFGGTNFHVVLEEYLGGEDALDRHVDLMPRAAELFTFARNQREDLLRAMADLERQLAGLIDLQAANAARLAAGQPQPQPAPSEELAQLARAVHLDRQRLEQSAEKPACRLTIVADSLDDLREKLRLALAEIPQKQQIDNPQGLYYSEAPPLKQQQVCFLFPGQGSQSLNMLKDLMLMSPWAWPLLEEANRDLAEFFDQPLSRLIYPLPVFSDEQRQRQQERLKQTQVAQPALGLVEVFAHELLGRFGIRPGMVAGHSYGELVALHAAGVYTAEDLLKLSAVRGLAVYEAGTTAPGAMAAVMADAASTAAALAEANLHAQMANYNSDVQTVIAGPIAVIDEAVEKLAKKGVRVRKLAVTAAFHTPAVRQARQRMEQELLGITLSKPRLPVYSNTTARPYPTTAAEIRRLQGEHLTSPVQFIKLLEEVYKAGARVFLEVGPGGVLTGLVRQNLKEKPHWALQLDGGQRDGCLQFAHLLARLIMLGLPVNLEPWFENRRLGGGTVAALFDDLRAKHQRKPTDWIVTPGGVRPWAGGSNSHAQKPTSEAPPTPAAASAPEASSLPAREPVVAAKERGAKQGPPTTGESCKQSTGPSRVIRETVLRPPVPTIMKQSRLEAMIMEQQAQPRGTTQAPIDAGNRSTADLMVQFQSAMTRWLEMQQQQQLLNQQFLEVQQTVMLACLRGAAELPAPAASPPPLAAATAQPVPATTSKKMQVPPAPVLPSVQPGAARPGFNRLASQPAIRESEPSPPAKTPTAAKPTAMPPAAVAPSVTVPATPRVSAQLPAAVQSPVVQEKAMAVVVSAASSAPAVATDDGMPSLETFRQDLLQTVSDRTGYPIEMLDETLELEAGLGIDSIKTIEIFDMLSKYHAYLLGGDENQQETLASFAKLRTLSDILAVYETSVSRKRQQAGANGDGRPASQTAAPAVKPPAMPVAMPAVPPTRPAVAPAVQPTSVPPRATSTLPPTAEPPAAQKAAMGVGVSPAAAKDDGIPSLETFRHDLLQAVSERTGYPIEMLDETLELEAGLGIDSIKTIEIFDTLSKYHALLLGGDENQQETLASFAKLRTLGDILAAYQSNADRKRQQAAAVGRPVQRTTASADAAAPQVQRATVQAVQAPPSDGSQKKNDSLATTSY